MPKRPFLAVAFLSVFLVTLVFGKEQPLSKELVELFQHLDELGRDKLKHARLEFAY